MRLAYIDLKKRTIKIQEGKRVVAVYEYSEEYVLDAETIERLRTVEVKDKA